MKSCSMEAVPIVKLQETACQLLISAALHLALRLADANSPVAWLLANIALSTMRSEPGTLKGTVTSCSRLHPGPLPLPCQV